MFHKEFDKALWLILESDTENRAAIIDLLMAIPDELKKEIGQALKASEEEYLDGSITLNDGTNLQYEIDIQSDESILTISKGVKSEVCDDAINMCVELTLVWEKDKGLISEYWLGALTYICDLDTDVNMSSCNLKGFMPAISTSNMQIRGLIREEETEYNLVVTRENVCVELRSATNNVYIPVDINMMPDNLTMEYIVSHYGEDPLSRKRVTK